MKAESDHLAVESQAANRGTARRAPPRAAPWPKPLQQQSKPNSARRPKTQKSMRLRRGEGPPIRLLTAVPICDGHDSAINTINLELIRQGVEVIYLGYHRSARDIVRAAIQEDARAIGISSYNGGHIEFFAEVLARLKQQGVSSIGVFGGGGGTITPDDAARMKGRGVDEIFFAGTPLHEMVEWIKRTYRSPAMSCVWGASPDRQLAHLLSSAECRWLNFLALSPS